MIRKAVASDLADVERIAAQAFAPYVERIGANPAPMDADYAGPIARECTWVAVSGTAVAGFCVVIPEDGSMLLDVVAVAGDSRGQGLGRQLIAFAEDLARAAGRPGGRNCGSTPTRRWLRTKPCERRVVVAAGAQGVLPIGRGWTD